jgi:predicted GIY-YIG superfamily endonuclease
MTLYIQKGFSSDCALGRLVWYEHHPGMAPAINRETQMKA